VTVEKTVEVTVETVVEAAACDDKRAEATMAASAVPHEQSVIVLPKESLDTLTIGAKESGVVLLPQDSFDIPTQASLAANIAVLPQDSALWGEAQDEKVEGYRAVQIWKNTRDFSRSAEVAEERGKKPLQKSQPKGDVSRNPDPEQTSPIQSDEEADVFEFHLYIFTTRYSS